MSDLSSDNIVRAVISLPFILFFPGYALTVTLFPERKSLKPIERIGLSFGFSISVIVLLGIGLNYTPFGIRLYPILWFIILFNILFCTIGTYRRTKSNNPFVPFKLNAVVPTINKQFKTGTKYDKLLTVALTALIILSVIVLVYMAATPKSAESYSEFYILGPNGKAIDYPENLTVNQSGEVILGIANHEGYTVNYSVEVWVSNMTQTNNITVLNELLYMGSFSINLESISASPDSNWTKQWEMSYNISIPIPGEYKIWFILLENEIPFQGTMYEDYVNTTGQTQFLNMIASDDYSSLNINLNIIK